MEAGGPDHKLSRRSQWSAVPADLSARMQSPFNEVLRFGNSRAARK
jgi:hypothetical protein